MNQDSKNIIKILEERMRWLRAAAQRLLNKAGKVEYQIRQARDRRAAPPPPPAEDATPD